MKKLLNVGAGDTPLPDKFSDFREYRVDIDPFQKPDFIAPMTNLGVIGEYDLVWCSHALEHIYAHEVPKALSEFYRVLKPGGALVLMVPDLEDVRPDETVLYDTPLGPVTGMDLIYGLRNATENNPHMAHKTGFTAKSLAAFLVAAGFEKHETKRLELFNLMGVGIK
jgi:SAM-dependent methyltransferase